MMYISYVCSLCFKNINYFLCKVQRPVFSHVVVLCFVVTNARNLNIILDKFFRSMICKEMKILYFLNWKLVVLENRGLFDFSKCWAFWKVIKRNVTGRQDFCILMEKTAVGLG